MIKYVKFIALTLFLCITGAAISANLIFTQTDEAIQNDSTQIQDQETPETPQPIAAKKPPKPTKICKITSSASEKWIKKNYKNCRKCGVYRNQSQKTYYCYCDCENF